MQIGYFTIGRGMRNKQNQSKIYIEYAERKLNLVFIGRVNELDLLYNKWVFTEDHDKGPYRTGLANSGSKGRTNHIFIQCKGTKELFYALIKCELLLSNKYPSLNFVVDQEKLNKEIFIQGI